MKHAVVKFRGKRYLLIGDEISGGAIATKTQYENGLCSFAHLQPDGRIMRFHEVIGKRADLVFTGERIETKIRSEAWNNLANWPDWIL